MLRDNLAGSSSRWSTARELIPSVVITKRDKQRMLQVHRGGNRRSEAILAPKFSLENGVTGRKKKMARFRTDHRSS
jgi:hypothetical protein